MKILYVSQYFPPEPGAPAARVSELARAWADAGHEVTVLTGMPNHPAGRVPPAYRRRALVREGFHGVSVLRTWIYAAANRGRVRRSAAYASFSVSAAVWGQLHVPRPDVIVGTSPQLLCALAAGAIGATRRVPWVFEVRDLWPESVVAVGALSATHPVIRGLERLENALYRHAAQIVVVTDGFERRLVARGIPARKIAVVKNGVDLERFVPRARDTALRARLGWEDRTVIAYTGTHGMAHGLDCILDVAERLIARDDLGFLFVGDGAERGRLVEYARARRLANVKFLGMVPRDAINEAYATADVCLVPLRRSALFTMVIPSKIFEILAMERPIVISVDGEAREIVEAAEAGIYAPPEDVGAIADAIVALAGDRPRREAMGRAGRVFVTQHFDRRAIAARYLALLEDVARARA